LKWSIMVSRTDVRREMGELIRITLLENDVDTFESALKTTNKLLFGILVTLTTTSVLLALNVTVKGGF
jgi:hypothetical protein